MDAKIRFLLACLVLMAVAAAVASAEDDGCAVNFIQGKNPTVKQTKKNKIRVGWGKKVDNLDCLDLAEVQYWECSGGDYGYKSVPRKEEGNGASFIVNEGGCYNVDVTLVGTDGNSVTSDVVTIQLETDPEIEVIE